MVGMHIWWFLVSNLTLQVVHRNQQNWIFMRPHDLKSQTKRWIENDTLIGIEKGNTYSSLILRSGSRSRVSCFDLGRGQHVGVVVSTVTSVNEWLHTIFVKGNGTERCIFSWETAFGGMEVILNLDKKKDKRVNWGEGRSFYRAMTQPKPKKIRVCFVGNVKTINSKETRLCLMCFWCVWYHFKN